MKKSTKLLTASLILGAALSVISAPRAHGSYSRFTIYDEYPHSLMEYAYCEFGNEYPNEDRNNPLTDEQLAKIKKIVTSCHAGSGLFHVGPIDDMNGLEKLTSLETLDIETINISSVDFSHNPNLKILSLYGNDSILSSINLSNNLKLETLHLTDNPIEFLDLSNNSELKDFITDNNPLVETGITPKKDGDKLVYNLSSLKFLTPSEDGTLTFPICDNIDCDNGHITYNEENMLLYVDNLEAISGEVQTFRCLLELCEPHFRLKLNEPEEEPEEDTLLSPDTGSFTENLSAANMTFPAIGIILGALATGLLGYKKNKIKE